jgi:drug/metabolite transporter (DMT)-like permease
VLPILVGVGAAFCFGGSTLCSARSSRLIGSSSVVAWMMLVGLVAVVPVIAFNGVPRIDASAWTWLVLSGLGNVVGLLVIYAALRIERVGIVAPVTSTEGAVAALIAVAAGESIRPSTGIALAVIVVGIVLAGIRGEQPVSDHGRKGVALALLAAGCFGVGLYATGRVGVALPVVWAVIPARAAGVVFLTMPLGLTSRLRLTRSAAPLVVAAGLAEVVGFSLFAVGARHGIAITAVLSSQFAAVASVGAFFVFGERLGRIQILGASLILAGVALLTSLTA